MRRVPVLTLASLVAVLGLVVVPVQAGTLFGTDTPDIRLAPGNPAEGVFDLGDFFDSATEAAIEYSATGAAQVADGVVTILGSTEAGKSEATFTATAGEELSVSSVVWYTEGLIQNVPGIDNNNRIAGVAGGNAFLNGIVPGSSVSSAEALELVNGGGMGSTTGTPATGSAALLATIGEVSVSYADTGLVVRTSELKEQGVGSAVYGGLTATIAEDGSYTLAADASFEGPFVVTLGNTADAVHVLAAKAVEVAVNADSLMVVGPGFGAFPLAEAVSFEGNAVTVTAQAGEGALFVLNGEAIETGEFATVSLNYNTSSTAAKIAVLGFDGALAANKLAYDNLTGGTIEAGAVKNAAMTAKLVSGKVLPGFQIFNPTDAAITVTVSDLAVTNAAPLADYAINPNATASLAPAGDLSAFPGGDGFDQNPADDISVAGGTAASDNNFASPAGAGCVELVSPDATNVANTGFIMATGVDTGAFVAECWVKKTASAAGTFFFVATDGANEAMTTVATDDMGDGWNKVIASGAAVADAPFIIVAQVQNATVLVDDISVRILDDAPEFFDADLMGL